MDDDAGVVRVVSRLSCVDMTEHDRQVALRAAQRSIRGCRRCVDAGHIPCAAPILHGASSAKVMVLGQAPGPGAAERPLPYSGPTGKTLRGWLAIAGFPDDAFYDSERFYLTSLTKCFPGKAKQGAGDRAPNRKEIALCREHLEVELRLVQPDLILALGRLSIEALVSSLRGLRLTDIVGLPRSAEFPAVSGALVLPLPHPSGVSRWMNLPENRALVVQAMEWLGSERERRGW